MLKKRVCFTLVTMCMLLMMLPVTAFAKGEDTLTVSTGGMNLNTQSYRYEILPKQKKVQLKVKYNGKNITKKARYTTSNKKVASVSKKGVLTKKGSGNCTITIKYNGKVKKLKVQTKHSWSKPVETDRGIPNGRQNWVCNLCEHLVIGGSDESIKIHYDDEHPGQTPNGYYEPSYTKTTFYVQYCDCGAEKPAPGYEEIYAQWQKGMEMQKK